MRKIILIVFIALLIIPIGAAIKISQIRTVAFDDFLQIRVTVESDKHAENVKVRAYILEYPSYASSGNFDLGPNRRVNLILPEVFPGYATVRITVSDDDGNKRTVHRFVEIPE